MELIDYVRMLGRHWVWVLLLTLLGIGTATIWVLASPKTYSATSELFVGSVVPERPTQSAVESEAASQYVLSRMPSYAALVTSPDVTNTVITQVGLTTTPAELGRTVTATVPPKTVLIRVSATADRGWVASSVANATAEALATKIEQLEAAGQRGVSPVAAEVVRPAVVPSAPSSPNPPLTLLLGALVGLGLGLVAASLREQASRRPAGRGRGRGRGRGNPVATDLPAVVPLPTGPTGSAGPPAGLSAR